MYRILYLILAVLIIFFAGCAANSQPKNDGVLIVPAKTQTSEQDLPADTVSAFESADTSTHSDKITTEPKTNNSDETVSDTKNTNDVSDTVNTGDNTPVEAVVYWVEGGSVWHLSKDCRSLARSKNIQSGTQKEAENYPIILSLLPS